MNNSEVILYSSSIILAVATVGYLILCYIRSINKKRRSSQFKEYYGCSGGFRKIRVRSGWVVPPKRFR